MRTFKYNAEVREYLREKQRKYLDKRKAKEVLPAKVETSLTPTTPLGDVHDGTKPD